VNHAGFNLFQDVRYFADVFDLLDSNMPTLHPNVATSLENYADLLRKMKRDAEAAKMEARAKAIRAMHARENPRK